MISAISDSSVLSSSQLIGAILCREFVLKLYYGLSKLQSFSACCRIGAEDVLILNIEAGCSELDLQRMRVFKFAVSSFSPGANNNECIFGTWQRFRPLLRIAAGSIADLIQWLN
uniref:Uncharacterized protein n=1 Tax=Physcomitrium patens TaxID=3218 RepID=A0A7I4C2B4_PHYPA